MAREPLAWISAAPIRRASWPSALTLLKTPGPGSRSVGSAITWTGIPRSRPREATPPSSGTTSAGAQRPRSSPRRRSIRLSSPPPTMWPWFDTTRIGVGRPGRSPTLADRQDPQPVARSGVEVAENVQARRGRPPEEADQARSIVGKLAAVEYDKAGPRAPSRREQIVRPDARDRYPAPLAVEGDEPLPVQQDRIAGLGRGDPACRLPVPSRASVGTQEGMERRGRKEEHDHEEQSCRPAQAAARVGEGHRGPEHADRRERQEEEQDRQEDPRIHMERERREGRQGRGEQDSVAPEPSGHSRARQHAGQHEEEQDPRQEIRHGVLLKEKRVLEETHRKRARHGGEARGHRQVVVDLAAEGEVPPDVIEVPDVGRCDDGEDEDGGAHPWQQRGGTSPPARDHEDGDGDQADEIQGAFGPHQVREPEAQTGEANQGPGTGHEPAPRGHDARDQEKGVGCLAQDRGRVEDEPRMDGDEDGAQEGGLATHDSPGESERGQDHERAEERGDPATRRLPVTDDRLGERDAERVERMEDRVEG